MAESESVPWRHDLATIDAVVASGVVRKTARRRVRVGRWTEPLPDVICRTNGTLTPEQWRTAALLYGGPRAALSHRSAGELYRVVSVAGDLPVEVTVPHGRTRPATDQVRLHQTTRPFTPWRVEGWPTTPPDRTAIDMALAMSTFDEVSALFSRFLQRDWVRLEALSGQLDAAPSRGSANAREVLASLAVGSRSAAEVRFQQLLRRYGLPDPELNAAVGTGLGTKYVDALWRQLGKGVEIDGQAFHLDAASWQADLTRQNAIQATGIVLLRIAARRLWTEPEAVMREVAAFLGLPLRLAA